MTTKVTASPADVEKLNANLARLEDLSQRLVAAVAQKRAPNPALEGPGPELLARTMTAFWSEAVQNPTKLIEQQAAYWGKALQHYIDAQQTLAQGKFEAPEDPTPKDRRFANPLWQTHPYFNFIKQQYLRNVEAMDQAVKGLEVTSRPTGAIFW